MTTSSVGRKLIEQCEGLKTTAYLDQKGIPTIGYGHTEGVKEGDTCTPGQADLWLSEDLAQRVDAPLAKLIHVTLNQNQYDAIASLVFNIGEGNFAESTLLKLLNCGDMKGAASQLLVWCKVRINGVMTPDRGLMDRRIDEKKLFETPMA